MTYYLCFTDKDDTIFESMKGNKTKVKHVFKCKDKIEVNRILMRIQHLDSFSHFYTLNKFPTTYHKKKYKVIEHNKDSDPEMYEPIPDYRYNNNPFFISLNISQVKKLEKELK